MRRIAKATTNLNKPIEKLLFQPQSYVSKITLATFIGLCFALLVQGENTPLLHVFCYVLAAALWPLIWWNRRAYSAPILSLTGATLLTIALLTPSQFENDYFRYFLDGQTLIHQMNPIGLKPADNPLLQDLNLEGQVGFPEVPTIYPPLTLAFFGLAAFISGPRVETFASLLSVISFLLLWIVLIRHSTGRTGEIMIFLSHPILIFELWHNHHYDGILAALLLLTATHHRWSGLWLAMATHLKYIAIALATEIPRHQLRSFLITLLAPMVFVALWSSDLVDSLGTFASHWEMNSGLFRWYRFIGASFAQTMEHAVFFSWTMSALTFLIGYRLIQVRVDDSTQRMILVLFLLLLVSPVMNPWYFTWLIPLLYLRHLPVLTMALAAVPLHYSFYQNEDTTTLVLALWNFEHLVLWAALFYQVFHGSHQKSTGHSRVDE